MRMVISLTTPAGPTGATLPCLDLVRLGFCHDAVSSTRQWPSSKLSLNSNVTLTAQLTHGRLVNSSAGQFLVAAHPVEPCECAAIPGVRDRLPSVSSPGYIPMTPH